MHCAPALVINADDFGYFPEVSRGIATCVSDGIVTATSLIVNRDTDSAEIDALKAIEHADHGVHLNVSHGTPVTDRLAEALDGKPMPGKFSLLGALVSGRISAAAIENEWRAQLGVARDGGITISFVNCHEHLHMFPGLYGRFLRLADEFAIPFMRYCSPEWTSAGATSGRLLRSGLFALTNLAARRPKHPVSMRLLGIAPSGALSHAYLDQILPDLKPGQSYELMCHPGEGIPSGAGPLAGYHRWDAERELLCDPETRELIERHGVRIARFTQTTV